MLDYRLRYLKEDDLPIILKWRNSERIRKYMYDNNIITNIEHENWFNKLSKSNDIIYYVFEYRAIPIGIVNFHKIDKINNICKWGFYIGALNVPKGSGLILGYLGLEKAFDVCNINKVIGEVLGFNIPSIKLHQKLGFKEERIYAKQVLKNGRFEDIISYVLFKGDWENNKDRLKEAIDLKLKECYKNE